jgi:hypothetical protein
VGAPGGGGGKGEMRTGREREMTDEEWIASWKGRLGRGRVGRERREQHLVSEWLAIMQDGESGLGCKQIIRGSNSSPPVRVPVRRSPTPMGALGGRTPTTSRGSSLQSEV